ncbi:cuticle collagen 13-like [Grus americana]|uniref:cuticle collagen 13-like n=1 Tax=Grus americana TaxID=9117 RepID=UPI002407A631|nr:cuticle collagen 13-like [Grus americana]
MRVARPEHPPFPAELQGGSSTSAREEEPDSGTPAPTGAAPAAGLRGPGPPGSCASRRRDREGQQSGLGGPGSENQPGACGDRSGCWGGESVTVWCEAVSSLPELTLLYWLGNGSFVEKLHPDGAVHEGTVLEEPRGSRVALRRDLHIDCFGIQHLHTNFTCVVLSPLGVNTREVRWLHPAPARAPVESGGLG